MEPSLVYFVRIAGAVRGPVGIEQLREMGSIEVITPETEIAPQANGPWVRLATRAICSEVFPARRAIEFKTAQFEEINRDSTPAVDLDETIERAKRLPAAFRGREVVVPPHVVRPPRDGDPHNEVQEMVLDVGRRVAAHAPVVVLPPPPPRFPRWPWFAALSVVGSMAIMSIPLLYDRRYDQMSVSILGMWTVMFNGLLVGAMMLDRRLSAMARSSQAKLDALR